MRISATRVSTYAGPSTSEEGLTEASLRQTVSRFFTAGAMACSLAGRDRPRVGPGVAEKTRKRVVLYLYY